jgi:hypothetical protein
VSEDAAIEPRTIASSALARLSGTLTTRLDLIHNHRFFIVKDAVKKPCFVRFIRSLINQ